MKFEQEPRDIITAVEGLPVEPGITLEDARGILQAVISTHEDSILPQTSLDQICGFSSNQLREALGIVANAIKEKSPYKHLEGWSSLEKKSSEDRIELLLFHDLSFENGQLIECSESYWKISMSLHASSRYFSIVDFSLDDPENHILGDIITGRHCEHYFQPETVRDVILVGRGEQQNGEPLNLDDYRHLFRGLRLLSTNMLEWEKPGIILPNQLDNLPIPEPVIEQSI